jgi:hypothetical protein
MDLPGPLPGPVPGGRTKPQRGGADRYSAARTLSGERRPLAAPQAPARRVGFRRLATAALFVLLLMLLFGPATHTAAYRTLGSHWARTDLAYTADPRLEAYARAAAVAWGGASSVRLREGGSDISIVVAPLLPPVYYQGQTAQANLVQAAGVISGCEVRVDPEHFFALSEAGRSNVVTHELGHCLGLDHSASPSLMLDPLLYGFTADDAAAIASLYPPVSELAATPTTTPTATPVATAVAVRRPAAPTPVSIALNAPTESIAAAAAPSAAPPAAPRPFAGELDEGWSLVQWAGLEGAPVECDCAAVYRWDGDRWRLWDSSAPDYLKSLSGLDPGESYWMLRR